MRVPPWAIFPARKPTPACCASYRLQLLLGHGSSVGSLWVAAFFRAQLLTMLWCFAWATGWKFPVIWSSMGCRETDSLCTSPWAVGEPLFGGGGRRSPLLLLWFQCLQECFPDIISLISPSWCMLFFTVSEIQYHRWTTSITDGFSFGQQWGLVGTGFVWHGDSLSCLLTEATPA